MDPAALQQTFFNSLKHSLPPHLSMVDEIAGVLNIGNDSVYRRLRGETPINISELKLLCDHFHISLDQVLQIQNDAVVFRAPGINGELASFEEYLRGILSQLKYFNSFKQKQLLYFCKDMTFFHFYLFPEIASFKTFFWIKTIQNHPEFQQKSFSIEEYSFNECFAIGQEIIQEYNQIPSVELWNYESINSSISQIEYYRDAGIFANQSDLTIVVDSLLRTLDHLQLQTEKGFKFMPGASEVSFKAPLRLYVNEVVLGSNTILAELDNAKLSIITYSVLSYLLTGDPRFNENAFKSFNNLVSRSVLISGTGEKERNKFFRSLKEKVRHLKI
jgi:hypothetical protein